MQEQEGYSVLILDPVNPVHTFRLPLSQNMLIARSPGAGAAAVVHPASAIIETAMMITFVVIHDSTLLQGQGSHNNGHSNRCASISDGRKATKITFCYLGVDAWRH